MKYRNIVLTIAISIAVANLTVFIYAKCNEDHYKQLQESPALPVHNVNFKNNRNSGPSDFTQAALASTPAVVFIQTRIKERHLNNSSIQKSPFDDFFGNDPSAIPEQQGSGSGVILSRDGYIVTNNHVIKNADEITVTLANHKTFKASVTGTDAKSD